MAVDKNIRILLVEDSSPTRKIESRILKNSLGFSNVQEAVDGESATELLQSGAEIDLIISDWNMLQISGLDLLKWVRTDSRLKDTPFIMATGQGEKSQIAVALEAGVNGVVSKPFSPDDLMAKIEQTFSGEQGQQSTVNQRDPAIGPDGRVIFSVAHIQITDHLVLGVAKHLISSGEVTPKHFDLETRCAQSWNPVAEQLENGMIDGALILAPMAFDLFGFGVPLRLILLAHKNGSIMVRNKMSRGSGKELFQNKTFYLPHQLSVHHMLTHMYMSEMGLNPGVAGKKNGDLNLEIVPPIRMPELLAGNASAAGFMVAEPLGTKAISANTADQVFLSGEVWDNHPCCVVVFRQELLDAHAEAVEEFVCLLVRAGKFIKDSPDRAAAIAVKFLDPKGELGLKETVLENVLTEPIGIRTHDLYPIASDLKAMQSYMVDTMKVGQSIDIDRFLELRFADIACQGHVPSPDQPTSLQPGTFLAKTRRDAGSNMTKLMLGKEGKYLFTRSAGEDYGIGIMNIREIVGQQELIHLPEMPPYLRGVMNLRDSILPVLDLNLWFKRPPIEMGERIAIIVVEDGEGSDLQQLGLMVENVSEILEISADNVESAPEIMAEADYILAVAKINGEAKILLDVTRIVQDSCAP
jgi:chemotaxis signal transduction protein/ABC-type nitrate/sulfonate/bicarbonate transport system substrate-binding protein/ActR/RegA family two-component response regulator